MKVASQTIDRVVCLSSHSVIFADNIYNYITTIEVSPPAGHPHLRLHWRPVRRGHRCPGGAGAQRDGGPGQDTLQHQAGRQDGEEEHVNSVHFVQLYNTLR